MFQEWDPLSYANKYAKILHLEEGTGDPWAGHKRLKDMPDLVKRMEPFDAAANFGADPPIGSKIFENKHFWTK